MTIRFETTVTFTAPRPFVWDALKKVELFETWWEWMRDVRLEGEALTEGSTISFTIDPPIPYRMDVVVDVVAAVEGSSLEGRVTGDLDGRASLRLAGDGASTDATVGWDVEITSPVIRPVIRIARPVLVRAQTWAVRVALRGFRDHLEREGYPS